MQQNHNLGSTRAIITLVGLLAFAVLAFALVKADKTPESQYAETKDTSEVERTEVRSADLPPNIPVDLPYLNQGIVLQNFSNRTQTNVQSVRRWVVGDKTETVLANYQTYFTEQGWSTISSYSDNKKTLVGVAKGEIALSVTASPATDPNQTIIEISTNTQIKAQ